MLTAVPVLLTCVVSMKLLPESPRWLLSAQHRREDAEDVLTAAVLVNMSYMSNKSPTSRGHGDSRRSRSGGSSGGDSDSDTDTDRDRDRCDSPMTAAYLSTHPILLEEPVSDPSEGSMALLVELLDPQHVAVTLPLGIVWACFGAAYYGVLLFTGELFSSTSDDDAADDDTTNTCAFEYGPIFITAVAEFVGCVLIVWFVDSQGRVRTQSVAYGVGAVGCLLMGE